MSKKKKVWTKEKNRLNNWKFIKTICLRMVYVSTCIADVFEHIISQCVRCCWSASEWIEVIWFLCSFIVRCLSHDIIFKCAFLRNSNPFSRCVTKSSYNKREHIFRQKYSKDSWWIGCIFKSNFFLFTSSILLCLADRRFSFSWIFFIRNWIHWPNEVFSEEIILRF